MNRSIGGRSKAVVLLIVVLVIALGFVAFRVLGDTSDEGPNTAITSARYCQLADQLDDSAASTAAASAPGNFDGASPALTELVTAMGGALDEMVSTAPDEIRSQVDGLVAAIRDGASGNVAALTSPTLIGSLSDVAVYRQAHCPANVGLSGGTPGGE